MQEAIHSLITPGFCRATQPMRIIEKATASCFPLTCRRLRLLNFRPSIWYIFSHAHSQSLLFSILATAVSGFDISFSMGGDGMIKYSCLSISFFLSLYIFGECLLESFIFNTAGWSATSRIEYSSGDCFQSMSHVLLVLPLL